MHLCLVTLSVLRVLLSVKCWTQSAGKCIIVYICINIVLFAFFNTSQIRIPETISHLTGYNMRKITQIYVSSFWCERVLLLLFW